MTNAKLLRKQNGRESMHNCQNLRPGFFCFNFPFNPPKFNSHHRNWHKKVEQLMIKFKVLQKIDIWQLAIWQNWCVSQSYLSRIKVLQNFLNLNIFLFAFLQTAEVFAILVGGVFCGEEVSLAKSSQIDCPSFCLSTVATLSYSSFFWLQRLG